MTLAEQIDRIAEPLRSELERLAFDRELLLGLAARLGEDADAVNRLPGGVEPPRPEDLVDLPAPGSAEARRLEAIGLDALGRGELAVIVLAGGMATRMGGVIKALVPAVAGKTFLELRLAENARWSAAAGRPVPLWLMTSWATDARLREALGARLDRDRLATFVQNVSLRLTHDGNLLLDASGRPSVYAPGHGDLPEALARSGLLARFVASGGKYVSIANIDNLGATIDPVLVGWHAEHGDPITVEVVDKVGSDKGGVPVRWNGRRVILEELRVPRAFDPSSVRQFNTNTFVVGARALAELDMKLTWVQVLKNVEGRKAVQFERLVGEVTTALATRFLRVPREGVRSRFLPVKDNEELERRRAEIEAVARDRGMLG
jgi:UTP--glucose-1-phosphate uridylyltransferase